MMLLSSTYSDPKAEVSFLDYAIEAYHAVLDALSEIVSRESPYSSVKFNLLGNAEV